ncbi:MAG: hypothetical protein PHR49_06975, partial [Methanoculleus sp.]|nr:hypothetical protein [Methanoculleus sp.]
MPTRGLDRREAAAQAGTAVMCRWHGRDLLAATRPTASLGAVVRHADRALVLDGCGDCYGKKGAVVRWRAVPAPHRS